MALWGKTSNAESRPKSLPMDSNSSYSREFVTANKKGWVFQPGTASAATGNDNASAAPEILVCIRNLSVETQSANLLSIDYTAGAYADAADFDLVLTFDEAITVTSAAATANNTITNNAYVVLSELGATDMAEDSQVKCQYQSGSGTNTLTFRGRLNTTANGYLAFADGLIHLDGTSAMVDPESELQTFIDDMIETMHHEGGVGLAAPQVNQSIQIVVLEYAENNRYPGEISIPLTVLINPVLSDYSKETKDGWESCLSLVDFRGLVPRSTTITLNAYDRNGRKIQKTVSGFEAVVLQHEIDHLQGYVFIDRMKDFTKLSYQEEFEKFWVKKEETPS